MGDDDKSPRPEDARAILEQIAWRDLSSADLASALQNDMIRQLGSDTAVVSGIESRLMAFLSGQHLQYKYAFSFRFHNFFLLLSDS